MKKGNSHYKIKIDGEKHILEAPVVTGRMLKELADVDPISFDVWLEVRGQGDDLLVANNEEVRLDEPGVEKFYTAECSITVIINGRPREANKRVLSFAEIVNLAFPDANDAPNTIYTMVYKNGPDENPQGSLVEGQTITIKNRMIINVTKTDKS